MHFGLIVFKVIQSHSLWQGTKEFYVEVCHAGPRIREVCWGGTGRSGFSQDRSGLRWLRGLTATRVFPRKTFQKGREKKTTSPSITSHLDPALFPFHARVGEEKSRSAKRFLLERLPPWPPSSGSGSHLQGRRSSRSVGAPAPPAPKAKE